MKNKLIIGLAALFFLIPGLSISCGKLDEVVHSEHPESTLDFDAIEFDFSGACVTLDSLKDDHTYEITCSATSVSDPNQNSFLTELTGSTYLFYGHTESISLSGNAQITLHGVHPNNAAGRGFIWSMPDILWFKNLHIRSFDINCHATDLTETRL